MIRANSNFLETYTYRSNYNCLNCKIFNVENFELWAGPGVNDVLENSPDSLKERAFSQLSSERRLFTTSFERKAPLDRTCPKLNIVNTRYGGQYESESRAECENRFSRRHGGDPRVARVSSHLGVFSTERCTAR